MSDTNNRYVMLHEKAEAKGVKLTDAIRKAEQNYNTIKKWETKQPDAFESFDKIDSAIDTLAAEKLEREQAQAEAEL